MAPPPPPTPEQHRAWGKLGGRPSNLPRGTERVRITVSFRAEDVARLKAEARNRGVSVSDLVREAIEIRHRTSG